MECIPGSLAGIYYLYGCFASGCYRVANLDKKEDLTPYVGDVDIDLGHKKIREWCQDNLKKMRSNDRDLCAISPSAPRSFSVGAGSKAFIKDLTEEESKVSYAVFRWLDGHVPAIDSGDDKDFDVDEGGKMLRNWCRKELSKDLSGNFPNLFLVSWYCNPLGYKTVGEQMEKVGRPKIVDDDMWKASFVEHKQMANFSSLIKAPDDIDDATGGSKLKAWCSVMLNKNVYDREILDDKYVWAFSACTTQKFV